MYKPIGTTIGLEIETANIPLHLARERLGHTDGFSVVEDGSVRRYQNTMFGLPTITVSDELVETLAMLGLRYHSTQMGAEIVSDIIFTNSDNWELRIMRILENIQNLGEGIAISTGIHIHVNGVGLPVEMLKNLIRLWMALESGIYRLSCGPLGVFRGEIHKDAHYCRPLVKEGPLVWHSNGKLQQCYSIECLLNAKNELEFAQAYGRSDAFTTRHWHTPRYSGINFHSLFRLGSIEFRTFNASLVPSHVFAWIELCKAIVHKAMEKRRIDLPEHPYGSNNMAFDYVLDTLEITDDLFIGTLEKLWDMGKFPMPLKGHRFTHLGQVDGFDWGRIGKHLIPPYLDSDTRVYGSDSEKNEDSSIQIENYISIDNFVEALMGALSLRRI
jgi:hypothetical protein